MLGLLLMPLVAHADSDTVKVGLVGTADRPVWNQVAKAVKSKYDINVKFTTFTDYNQPNQALVKGSIDLNSFQTWNFFADQNKQLGDKLVGLGKTYITPIKLYSKKLTSIKELKHGSTIVVPNDPSNEVRALKVLADAGLIKYDHKITYPTVKNITDNPKGLSFKEVADDQTVASLASEDAAIVNTNYALDAKLSQKEVLYTEPVNKQTAGYINWIVAKKDEQHNKTYAKIVKMYQTAATKRQMKQLYGQNEIAAWDITLK
ncbi:MetQ/NlpA family ABC transporter substrate-binding protein [Weissella muntiaci]|uniref:MetQ/NlpA family ABC transporter substrate-binding protein n=2 Tax=Weissella muntiaci TaxID=2508881 RepID=A0A6C2C862_9LACO|nr:MetQ/NlpA family ABC transporter substrate-binding protein [Weissella muntiaci]